MTPPTGLPTRFAGWISSGCCCRCVRTSLCRPTITRGTSIFCDFATHGPSHGSGSGRQPYAHYGSSRVRAGAGRFNTDHCLWLALMPPGAFAALAPLAALPPGVAAVAWTLVSALSIVVIIAAIMRMAQLERGTLVGWIFIAAAVASAPIQTLLAVGQISLPVIALIVAALAMPRTGATLCRCDARRGAASKPQLALRSLWFLFFKRGACSAWRFGRAWRGR